MARVCLCALLLAVLVSVPSVIIMAGDKPAETSVHSGKPYLSLFLFAETWQRSDSQNETLFNADFDLVNDGVINDKDLLALYGLWPDVDFLPTATPSPSSTPSPTFTPTPSATPTPTEVPTSAMMRVFPEFLTVTANETQFEFDIMVDDVVNLGAYQVNANFDPSKFTILDVAQGDFLGSTGRNLIPVPPQIDNTGGTVAFGSGSYGPGVPANPGPNGSGTLATVRCQVVSPGSSVFDIQEQDSQITDIEGAPLPIQSITDGNITIQN